MRETLTLKKFENHEYDFFKFIAEDKSQYRRASEEGYKDLENNFLIGNSGGFLMNIDFIFVNTDVFNEVARYHEEYDRYPHHPYTKERKAQFQEFVRRETYRRKYGMTANCKLHFKDIDKYFDANTTEEERKKLLKPLHITGDHYNFLNYGRILRSLRPDEIAKRKARGGKVPKKIFGFPNFIDGQWWNFKIDEFIYNNDYHLCKSKARRKGFSYMRGSQAANTVNLNKDVSVALAAYDLKYLIDPGATTDMAKKNLDWYESQTYWTRGYLSEDYSSIELGYKRQKTGNRKWGWRSKILSAGCRNNESALVGKDVFEIDLEEAGKFPNMAEVLKVTTSTTEDGDTKVGTIRIYGTGGTKNANWEAFSKVFFAPNSFEMMPFENIWDKNLRHTTCGFFYPQVWGYGTYVDEHGNSQLYEAYEHDAIRKEEYKKNNTAHDTILFISQRANRPTEAFLNTHDNLFASDELNSWIIRLQHDPDVKFWKDGMVVKKDGDSEDVEFKTNEQLKEEGIRTHEYIEQFPIRRDTDVTGCIRMFYEPYTLDGKVPDDLYFITSDSVGIDKDKKELTLKHSLNSFSVWMKDNNNTIFGGKRLVASYCGRYNTLKEYDTLLLYVSLLYNAKILPEVNRGETLANFKTFKKLSRILKDPRQLIAKGKYSANAGYGMVIGDGDTKLEGLRMLKEILYTQTGVDGDGNKVYYLHSIYDLPFLFELQKFSLIGNFDRISNAILAAFQFKAFEIKDNKDKENRNKKDDKLINRLLLYGN